MKQVDPDTVELGITVEEHTELEWFKEKKFRPSSGERLTGYAPEMAVYNV